MNSTVEANVYRTHRGPVGLNGRFWVVAVAILGLLGLALYSWILFLQNRIDLDWALIEFFTFSGMAVAYGFGFFRYFPELLVAHAPLETSTLRRRWSDFSLLTAFVALVGTGIAYAWTISANFFFISLPVGLPILAASALLLSACAVASGRYLSCTLPTDSAATPVGWRSHARHAISRFGGWLITAVRGKRSLIVGAVLVLASLLLPVRADPWAWHVTGYHYALASHSRAGYPARHQIPWSDLAVGQGRRLVYILAVGIAVTVLIVSALRPWLSRHRDFPFLTSIAGSVAFFEVADLRPNEYEVPMPAVLVLWIVACLIPIILWLVLTRGTRELRDGARLALMLFEHPVFLAGFSCLPVQVYLSLGQGPVVAGMLLLWWGLLQPEGAKDSASAGVLTPRGSQNGHQEGA